MTRVMIFDKIEDEDYTVELVNTIMCELDFEDGYFVMESKTYNILSYAKTIEETKKQFIYDFIGSFLFLNEDGHRMTDNAIELRDTYRKVVRNIVKKPKRNIVVRYFKEFISAIRGK